MQFNKTGISLKPTNTNFRTDKNVSKPASFKGNEPGNGADSESQKVNAGLILTYNGNISTKKADKEKPADFDTVINKLWDNLVSDGRINQEDIDTVDNPEKTPKEKIKSKLRYINSNICSSEQSDINLSFDVRKGMLDFIKENNYADLYSDLDMSASNNDLISAFINTKIELDFDRQMKFFDNICNPVAEFARSLGLSSGFDKKSFATRFEDIPKNLYSDIGALIRCYISDCQKNDCTEDTDKQAYLEKIKNFDYSKSASRISKLREVFGDKSSLENVGSLLFEEDDVFDAKINEYKNKMQSLNCVSYTDENGNIQERSLKDLQLCFETDQIANNAKELAKLTYIDETGKTAFRFNDTDINALSKFDVEKVKELAQITYKDTDGNIQPRFNTVHEFRRLIIDGYDIEQIKKVCEFTVEKVERSLGDDVYHEVRPLDVYTLCKVLKSGVDIDFMADMMKCDFNIYGKDAKAEEKIEYIQQIYKKYPDKLDEVKAAMLDFGIEYKKLDETINECGDKLIKLSDSIKDVRAQYGIEESQLEIAQKDDIFALIFTSRNYGDDTYIRITDKNGNVFKFDRKTLDLVTVSMPDRTVNIRDGIVTKVDMDREYKIEFSQKDLEKIEQKEKDVKEMIEKKIGTPTRVEFYVNKTTGEEISHQEMLESKNITGEYEIYSYDANGNKHSIGLAEIDSLGGKHVEKHLKSLDGTVTDTVYASDKEGQTFMSYKITTSDGKVEYDAMKIRQIIDDNHFITKEKINGVRQVHDIQISGDKVTVTKLDEQGNKTSEVAEFNIADFSDDTYKEVNEVIKTGRKPEDVIDNLSKIMHDAGNEDYTIDRRLLPMLKKMSGKQWMRLKENGTKYIVSGSHMENNAASIGGFITFSKEMEDKSFVFLHEAGHERFGAMDLVHDEEIRKIYEEEKALYTATFPDDMIAPIEYFLFANDVEELKGTGQEARGLNEGVAETNALTETHQEWDAIQARTVLWQQFFPRTIAVIARKLEECSK